MNSLDPYSVLGVRPNASQTEIELAYKGRRSQYHPDRYANEGEESIAWATGMMQQVNEAYALLSDPAYRQGRKQHETRDSGARSSQEAPASGDPAPATFAAALFQSKWSWDGLERIFARPRIPKNKLRAAIDSYAWDVKPGEVLVLVDDTLFGGAKEGVLVTGDAIYAKQKFEEVKRIPLFKISKIEPLSNSRMAMNGVEFFRCNVVDHGEFGMFAARLEAARKASVDGGGATRPAPEGREPKSDGPDEGVIEHFEQEIARMANESSESQQAAFMRLTASMLAASSKIARMLEKEEAELSEEEAFVVSSDLFRFEVFTFILSDTLAAIQNAAGQTRAMKALEIIMSIVVIPILISKERPNFRGVPSEQEQFEWFMRSPRGAAFKHRMKVFGSAQDLEDSVSAFVEHIQAPIMLDLYEEDEQEAIEEVLGDLVETVFDEETVEVMLRRIQRLVRSAVERYLEATL
ncbi:MAG: J domain-containing protein [Xanthomonadales bacterium]|nr:J domain-containing protein [Xanthomonadales bacterium]